MLPLLCPAGPSELHQTPAAQGVCPDTGPWFNLERPPRGPISCIPVKPSGLSPHLVSSSAVGPWRKGAFLCLEEAQHTCKATGRDELCRAERAAQLQGTIPVRQISFSRPGKATREEQRCREQKWVSRCANNSSDLLPNRTVIYAANCFHTGKLKHLHRLWLRKWGEAGRPFGPSMHMSRHMHTTWVCDSEKTAILTSEDFILDSFSWNPPPLIFFFGCIKLGILKACFLVWWFLFCFFFSSFFFL